MNRLRGRVRVGVCQKSTLLLALLFCLAHLARAQEARTAFLFLDPSASSAGMGETGVAFRTGPWSVHSNPAGLAAGGGNAAAVSYRTWLGNLRMVTASARLSGGASSGIGIFAAGMIDGGGEDSGQGHTTAGVAAAQRFGPLSAGLTLRYVSERIDPYSTSGIGFDAGVRAATKGDLLQAGASLSHVALAVKESEGLESPFPRTLRLGVAARPFEVVDPDGRPIAVPLFAVDYVVPDLQGDGNSEGQWHMGLGVEVFETAIVRAGYIANDAVRDWTLGLGLHQGAFAFDYAFQPFTEAYEGGTGHVFSLTYTW